MVSLHNNKAVTKTRVLMNREEMKMTEQVSICYDGISFGYVHKNSITMSGGTLILNFLRNYHIDFSEWLCKFALAPAMKRVPLTPHPCQYEQSLALLILVILAGVHLSLGLVLLPLSSILGQVSQNSGISSILGSPKQSQCHSLTSLVLHAWILLTHAWPK